MRRLVVELYGKELERRVRESWYGNVRSIETVHLLKHDQSEIVGIWRLRLKDPLLRVEDCFKDYGEATEVQLLEVLGREEQAAGEEEGPAFLVMMRRKPRPGLLLGDALAKPGGGYLFGPLSYKDGRIRFTFIGTQKDVKEILGNAEKRNLQYKVVSMTDADFAEDSLLNRLTDKQRRVLLLAYKLGYFDVPKKITSDELGARLHLTGSTVAEHLGKAERRLLDGIIGDS